MDAIQRIIKAKDALDKIDGENIAHYEKIPHLDELLSAIEDYAKQDDADYDTVCMIYRYAADQFEEFNLPRAVKCYCEVLKYAQKSKNKDVLQVAVSSFYSVCKFCEYIALDRQAFGLSVDRSLEEDAEEYALKIIDRNEVKDLKAAARELAGKTMRCDPVEHTEEFYKVLYELEKSVFDPANFKQGGAHLYWAKKKVFLKSKGIDWKSPKELNGSSL